ncbi:hypothetical protein ILUMI_00351, partial [Ignelater luminosus]
VAAQLRTNFFIKNLTFCPSSGPVKYSGYVTTENNRRQYMELDINSPIPLDEKINATFIIDSIIDQTVLVPLFEIHEKNFCKAMNKYVGELWYAMQRAMQVPGGVCPIRANHYHMHHHYLDFSRMTLQTFPFGTLRITVHAKDKTRNQMIFCSIVVVENMRFRTCLNGIYNILIFKVTAQLRTNFFIKNLTFCPSPGPIKYSGYVTTENTQQYIELDVKSPIPLDENIDATVIIDMIVKNKTIIQMFEIHETDFCKAMNKYLGEFWYDFERAAQLPAGVCPIRANHYHVHHHYLDFSKIALQTFPFGTLRFTCHAKDKMKKQMVFCVIMVVENTVN